jgi:hypothetical protein
MTTVEELACAAAVRAVHGQAQALDELRSAPGPDRGGY